MISVFPHSGQRSPGPVVGLPLGLLEKGESRRGVFSAGVGEYETGLGFSQPSQFCRQYSAVQLGEGLDGVVEYRRAGEISKLCCEACPFGHPSQWSP